ncbi:MAG: penicillin-binding transpeptidase domain-containing protein, partial [Chrysiogenales bacterium]
LQIKKGLSYFRLTMDAGLQRKIEHLFNDFFGTLLLLDLPQNSILAAYSKPRFSRAANAVFSEAFEPGSIIKIISLMAYLRQADQNLFPYVCPGQIVLGGKVFYDWTAHKQVKDYSEALALSCNLSFARMGLKVGSQRLASLLERFYFNARPFYDWFLKFQTGTFKRELHNDLELANLAVGLGEISLTTVHAALLAAVFSQNGLLFPPYIIDDAKSILDLGFYSHSARPLRLLADDLNFGRVKKAMREVVNNENGTGRRAWSAAVNLAIKTGTAGDRKQGLDALIIGFFPSENPRYAFAFRLEGAGKAEFNGAYFLRDLLKILYK